MNNKVLETRIADLETRIAGLEAQNTELLVALDIAKKGLLNYENRNLAHGTRNPAAIALDAISFTTGLLEARDKKRGASYLSDAERRSFDGYDGPIAVGDPAGQRPAIHPTRRGA